MIYENESAMKAIADVLTPLLQDGEFIIIRGAFRWRGMDGAFLPNHYECQSVDYLAEEHGYEVVHDLRHIAVVRRK